MRRGGGLPEHGSGAGDGFGAYRVTTLPQSDHARLREQTARAIAWVETHCAGSTPGSLVESRGVPPREAVYPLAAISDNASLWPTAAYLVAPIGMNDKATYGGVTERTANLIASLQVDDGGFRIHQDSKGRLFGEKYGNINYYANIALWYFSASWLRGADHAVCYQFSSYPLAKMSLPR